MISLPRLGEKSRHAARKEMVELLVATWDLEPRDCMMVSTRTLTDGDGLLVSTPSSFHLDRPSPLGSEIEGDCTICKRSASQTKTSFVAITICCRRTPLTMMLLRTI
eukprot:765790-Hanusia_phi.AAC.12